LLRQRRDTRHAATWAGQIKHSRLMHLSGLRQSFGRRLDDMLSRLAWRITNAGRCARSSHAPGSLAPHSASLAHCRRQPDHSRRGRYNRHSSSA
jgi:hypothetical protein